MALDKIYCPGGKPSQTGVAVAARYPDASIESCGDDIVAISTLLKSKPGNYAIPIWNSHVGEIEKSRFVWDGIEEGSLKLSDIWAKRIEFWWVRLRGSGIQYKKIGSVSVAEVQCSGFLAKNEFELEGHKLTTVAFDKYKEGAPWDGVLLADGQSGDEAKFEVIERRVANPNNFTSFVTATSTSVDEGNDDPQVVKAASLTGVTIQKFGASLGDAEQSLFTRIFERAKSLGDVPRLAFVFARESKVGLLFEGAPLYRADLLDAEEIESADIKVFEEIGAMKSLYSDQLRDLFSTEFPSLLGDDFILHEGVHTCLFACPPLGLFTHGFSKESVEPAIRFYIGRLFEQWVNGLTCSDQQNEFFKKYYSEWEEHGSSFIEFKKIVAT